MGNKKSNKPDRRGALSKETQATLDRIEQLLTESKRLQQQHAALSKQLKELAGKIQGH